MSFSLYELLIAKLYFKKLIAMLQKVTQVHIKLSLLVASAVIEDKLLSYIPCDELIKKQKLFFYH